MLRTVVGVMGGASASEQALAQARELGRLIAEKGWVLVNGGRDCGVMAASAKGAAQAGGLVIGILPTEGTEGSSPDLDVAIPTGMGDGRNVINVLASRVVIALPGGAGTISEVALALKNGRPVVTIGFPLGDAFAAYYETDRLTDVATPAEAVDRVSCLLSSRLARG